MNGDKQRLGAAEALTMTIERDATNTQETDKADTEDELLLSPKKIHPSGSQASSQAPSRPPFKRPPSPLSGESYSFSRLIPWSPSQGRELKRARHDTPGELDNIYISHHPRAMSEPRADLHKARNMQKRATPNQASLKPDHLLLHSSLLPSSKGRARSVPLSSHFEPQRVPHLDFNNLPQSPRRSRSRSPSKERELKLRIISVPTLPHSLDAILDEAAMNVDEHGPGPCHSLPVSRDLLHESHDIGPAASPPPESVTPPPATSSPDLIEPLNKEVPSSRALPSQSLGRSEISMVLSTPPQTIEHLLLSSPLTPLPETPHPVKVARSSVATSQLPLAAPESNLFASSKSQTIPCSSSLSRLPRAALTAKSTMSDSQSAHNPLAVIGERRVNISSSQGTGLADKPSGSSLKPTKNAFAVLMAHAALGNGRVKTPAAGAGTKASGTTSKAGRFQSKGTTKFELNAPPPKPTLKAKMRPREKPKPQLVVPASLVTENDDDRLDHTPTRATDVLTESSAIRTPWEGPPGQTQVEIDRLAQFSGDETDRIAPDLAGDVGLSPRQVMSADSHCDTTLVKGLCISHSATTASVDLTDDLGQTKADELPSAIDIVDVSTNSAIALESSLVEGPTALEDSTKPIAKSEGGNKVPESLQPSSFMPASVQLPQSSKQNIPRFKPPVPALRRVTRSVSNRNPAKIEGGSAAPPLFNDASATSSVPKEPATAISQLVRSASEKNAAGMTSRIPRTPSSRKRTETSKSAQSSPSPDKIGRAASLFLVRPSVGPSGSSLANLSSALDKLLMPPPARPNTSLGFNEVVDNDNDNDANRLRQVSIDDAEIERRDINVAKLGLGRPMKALHRAATLGSHQLQTASSQPKTISKPVQQSMSRFLNPSSQGLGFERRQSQSTASRTDVDGRSKIFGLGFSSGIGRPGAATKVSKKTTLPSIMGSPVKGGDFPDAGPPLPASSHETMCISMTSEAISSGITNPEVLAEFPSLATDGSYSGKGKEGERSFKDGAGYSTRRASSAFQVLSQSLNTQSAAASEDTERVLPPLTPRIIPRLSDVEDQSKDNMPSPTINRMSTRSVTAKTAPGALGKTKSGTDGHVSSKRRKDPQELKKSLDILHECVIFVDVRSSDGVDTSEPFTSALKDMGARLLTRVGQTCTHIVYKDGLASTVNGWRNMKSKPFVVGVSWVAECAEKLQRVDETKFLINLQHENVAGVIKRRRSMIPKAIVRDFPEIDIVSHAHEHGITIGESSSSASAAANTSGLAPLERVRRRTMLNATT